MDWTDTIVFLDWILGVNRFESDLKMAYKVLNVTDNMRDNYSPRKGLEGPFSFSGRVLYYDNKEGQYYDPRSDFYLSNEEMALINQQLADRLKA